MYCIGEAFNASKAACWINMGFTTWRPLVVFSLQVQMTFSKHILHFS